MAVHRPWAFGFDAAKLTVFVLAFSRLGLAEPLAPAPAPELVAPAPSAPSVPPAAVPDDPRDSSHGTLPELPPARLEAASSATGLSAQPPADEWYGFEMRLFADGYFGWNFNTPKPQSRGNGVIRAFDTANGFALAWAGLDISHPAQPIGGTLSLRFGPSAQRYNSSCAGSKCDADYDLQNVKQAFASWRPGGDGSPVTIDFGKFDTLYGAEVAESQDNINYTRGVLFWFGQPLFHTGLRVNADLTRNLSLRALVVNGWNNTIDNNTGKSFGLQATLRAPRNEANDFVSASIGYLGGPERDDTLAVLCSSGTIFDPSAPKGCSVGSGAPSTGTVDHPSNNSSGWRHFVDLVVTSDPSNSLHLVFNADYGVENLRDDDFSTQFSAHPWYGAMLGARYLVVPAFAVAGRAELYRDKDGITTGQVDTYAINDVTISTATLTLDYRPAPNLLLRLDSRLDHATRQMFPKGVRELTGSMFTSTLGVVVTTN